MPCRRQRSSKKRMKPSPCDQDRKSGGAGYRLPAPPGRDSAPPSKRLGAEEPTGGDLRQPVATQRVGQCRAALVDGAGMVDRQVALAAAGFVVTGQRADRLEQRRFAGAVLADDDGDRRGEFEFELVAAEERQVPGIFFPVRDPRGLEQDALEIGRLQPRQLLAIGHRERQPGSEIDPSSAIGKAGLCATSQTCPSASAK